jgi:hypothetical protein
MTLKQEEYFKYHLLISDEIRHIAESFCSSRISPLTGFGKSKNAEAFFSCFGIGEAGSLDDLKGGGADLQI